MTEKHTCPCCGFARLDAPAYEKLGPPPWDIRAEPPYEATFGLPSYEVCPCCGFEFGNDDNPGTAKPSTFAEYRSEWIALGCPWFSPKCRPENWSLAEQLKAALPTH